MKLQGEGFCIWGVDLTVWQTIWGLGSGGSMHHMGYQSMLVRTIGQSKSHIDCIYHSSRFRIQVSAEITHIHTSFNETTILDPNPTPYTIWTLDPGLHRKLLNLNPKLYLTLKRIPRPHSGSETTRQMLKTQTLKPKSRT